MLSVEKGFKKSFYLYLKSNNSIYVFEMATTGEGMDSILMELEAAIKNSYMSEFEDFIKNEVPFILVQKGSKYYRKPITEKTHCPQKFLIAMTRE